MQQQEKKKSGWEFLADKKGGVTHRQLIPPSLENDRFFNESSRSSWVLEIIGSCYVAGVGAIAGTSESVIFSNYRSMIKKTEASKLWEIYP